MSLPAAPLIGTLLGADLAVAGVTWLGSELTGRDGLTAAIAVLLVASPLAFLVARYAPLPVSRWLGRRDGITHLGSSADRALPRLRQLVIDVDHVVTTGHLVVVEVAPNDARHMHDLRWFAGALAHGSTDPVARAIAKLAGPGRPAHVSPGPAHELRGDVDRHPVRFRTEGLSEVAGDVGTTVRVDVDLRPMGHITVAEEVRKTAARCLSTLREEGIEPILVSASLGKPDLARIAEAVGVEQYHPGIDAATVAATLRPSTTGVLRVVPAPEADGRPVACETVLPREAGEDTVVRSASPSIDAALESVQHVRRLRRSRRLTQACAVAAVALAVPVAAAGILSPARAAIVAGLTLLLVAVVASSTVLMSSPATARD